MLMSFMNNMVVSGLYETAPMYETDQPPFLNGAVTGETDLSPSDLLGRLKEIERQGGRAIRQRNGPREVDLDIVAYGRLQQDGAPQLPHPRAFERRFVLEPLNEIAPHFILPGYGIVRDLLADEHVQTQQVRRISDAPILL